MKHYSPSIQKTTQTQVQPVSEKLTIGWSTFLLTDVRIIAALSNPSEDDTRKDRVSLINTGHGEVILTDWTVVRDDCNDFRFDDVILAAGEIRTFALPRNKSHFVRKPGKITLYDKLGLPVSTMSYRHLNTGPTIVF
mmetsp:Transcript_25427/g.29046  ORF Transcript_25427/g.29046 Transcript_25427/m.29046 type:complete len:137 (+) Transcript_25427:166-576(+)